MYAHLSFLFKKEELNHEALTVINVLRLSTQENKTKKPS